MTQVLNIAKNQMIERCPGKGRGLATKGLFSKVVAYDIDQVFLKMSFKNSQKQNIVLPFQVVQLVFIYHV